MKNQVYMQIMGSYKGVDRTEFKGARNKNIENDQNRTAKKWAAIPSSFSKQIIAFQANQFRMEIVLMSTKNLRIFYSFLTRIEQTLENIHDFRDEKMRNIKNWRDSEEEERDVYFSLLCLRPWLITPHGCTFCVWMKALECLEMALILIRSSATFAFVGVLVDIWWQEMAKTVAVCYVYVLYSMQINIIYGYTWYQVAIKYYWWDYSYENVNNTSCEWTVFRSTR